MTKSDLVTSIFFPPPHATGPDKVQMRKKETPLLLHWLALCSMLQLMDVDGLGPMPLFASRSVGCCLLLDDPHASRLFFLLIPSVSYNNY